MLQKATACLSSLICIHYSVLCTSILENKPLIVHVGCFTSKKLQRSCRNQIQAKMWNWASRRTVNVAIANLVLV